MKRHDFASGRLLPFYTSSVAAVLLTAFCVLSVGGCSIMSDLFPEASFAGADSRRAVRKIAVLPFAYRTAEARSDCDLCPNPLVLAQTGEEEMLLITAFFYEAVSRYPSFRLVPFETVEKFRGDTMAETVARLEAVEGIDAALVGGLLELRPRLGDPREPHSRGGAAVYAALVDAGTHAPLWSGVFDDAQQPPNELRKRFDLIVSGDEVRWLTAYGVAQAGAEKLIKDMAKTID